MLDLLQGVGNTVGHMDFDQALILVYKRLIVVKTEQFIGPCQGADGIGL